MTESRSLLILSCEESPGSVLEHLRAQGLTVICSDSPLQTSALLVKQPPDALYVSLTGLHPEEHEIVALARQHAPRALVVLGLRAEDRSDARRLLQAGADAYLLEPLVAEELLALLQQGWQREERAHRQARRSVGRQAVSQLARAIAHQVNNPLGTLSGWIQMLTDGKMQTPALVKMAQSAGTELDRLGRVVETLLILSEQTSPKRRVVELNELVRTVLASSEEGAGQPTVELSPGLPPVAGDEKLLSEALGELLRGETLSSAGTRPLELTTGANGRNVEVNVLLAGEGLDERRLEELLDPLRVFDQEGGEAALAFARAVGVVRVHGGEVTAEREIDGRPHLLIRLPVALG